jgi:hypothetical protein
VAPEAGQERGTALQQLMLEVAEPVRPVAQALPRHARRLRDQRALPQAQARRDAARYRSNGAGLGVIRSGNGVTSSLSPHDPCCY